MNLTPSNEAFCMTMLEHYKQRLEKRVCFCSDQEYNYLMQSKQHYENEVAKLQVQSLLTDVNNTSDGRPTITC